MTPQLHRHRHHAPTPDPTNPTGAFGPEARQALREIIAARRDVRRRFLPTPVHDDVLFRVLEAAHKAASVGLSQPWDFLILTDPAVRGQVAAHVAEERQRFAARCPSGRAQTFDSLKIEAIRESPLNIVVTSTLERGGAHVLGRYTQPEMAHYSTCLAIENLWLTARAEGLGVGWVSFYRPSVLSGHPRPARSRRTHRLSLCRLCRGVRPRPRVGLAKLGLGPATQLGRPPRKLG